MPLQFTRAFLPAVSHSFSALLLDIGVFLQFAWVFLQFVFHSIQGPSGTLASSSKSLCSLGSFFKAVGYACKTYPCSARWRGRYSSPLC